MLDHDEGGDLGEVSRVTLSPTVWAFVKDQADLSILVGPRREGKSIGAVAAILHLASEAQVPLKVAAVRDTWVNLRRSVIETLLEGGARGWWDVEIHEGGAEAVLNGGQVRLFLLGMDRPADANKFQGLEIGCLWLDDPAPAADYVSGIPMEVLALGMSSLSQAGVRHRVLITSNPPDEDHWLAMLITRERPIDLGRAMRVSTHWLKSGDNPHLPAGYRERMRQMFLDAGKPELVRRLVEGQIGSVQVGVAVAPEFDERAHVCRDTSGQPAAIRPEREWLVTRSWDAGLNPTVVYAATTALGRCLILGCLTSSNMGMEQFIAQHVLPWQQERGLMAPAAGSGFGRGARGGFRFQDVGDPACATREQSNSERSAARVICEMLQTTFRAAPPDWPARRDSLRAMLRRRLLNGDPVLVIDGVHAHPLLRALRGGWHYHKDSAGKVSELPVKDQHSHPGDAAGYATSVLFPVADLVRRAAPPIPRRSPTGGTYMGV